MARFVVRYRGKGTQPADALEKIRAVGSIVEDAGRMLLVEAPEAELRAALDADWLVAPEVHFARPDPRHSIK